MYKLVVLFAAVASCFVKPSAVAPLAYSAVVAAPQVITTISQQSRSVVHPSTLVYHSASAPLVHAAPTGYSAPLLAPSAVHLLKKRSLAAPLFYSANAAPAAISHQSRIDIHSTPVVSYAAAPVVSAYAGAAALLHSGPLVHAAALAYSAPLLAQPAVHLLKKRSLAAPLAFVAPAAVSHQLRVDIHSKPVVSYVAAPVVSAHGAAVPLVHSAPLANSAPLVHAPPLAYTGLVVPKAYGVHPY